MLGYAHPDSFPTAGKSGTLRVVTEGSQIRVYFNGVEVLTISDSTYLSGEVGLRVYGDASDAVFSNVSVKAQ